MKTADLIDTAKYPLTKKEDVWKELINYRASHKYAQWLSVCFIATPPIHTSFFLDKDPLPEISFCEDEVVEDEEDPRLAEYTQFLGGYTDQSVATFVILYFVRPEA